ncbi:RNA-binding protein 28 isoform X2 [Cinclus cinclus]|uniref:RNA-binding protein 28 isoform X2 n=1 Tax=Cinclus cinclus TaxID=127875 RepID=UPI002E0E8E29
MAAPEPRTVLVRGLPPGATAALLERLFGHLGPVRRCFVVTEKGSPQCRGFGYVTFSLAEDAGRALREPPELGGRRLGVTLARPRPRPEGRDKNKDKDQEPPPTAPRPKKPRGPSRKARLILRNLSFQCSEDELRALFTPFGPVLELNLPRKPDGNLRGFAFVQLQNLREAAAALRRLNGAQLRGRPLAVDWAVAKDKYQGTQGPPKTPEGEQKGKEKQEKEEEEEEQGEEGEGGGEEEEDEEEELEEEEEEEEKDEEEEEEAAQPHWQAPKGASEVRAGHRKKKKREEAEEEDEVQQEEDEEDEEEEPPRKRQQHLSDVGEGRTVFIRNLSFDTEEEELEETLSQFGGVSYVRLVLHPHTGTPKGCAFAQFKTIEGAQKCLEAAQEGPEGGGLRVGGRLLRVDPALSREQAQGLQGLGGTRPRSGTRNLYLAREGAIRPGSRAAEGVSDSDMAKRVRFEELKRRRLQDPNIGVSRTRLCLHNLPKALDTARLRALLRGVLRAPGGAAPRIIECRVMRELRGQGQSLGFAFVEFGEHEEALGALRRLNNNPELFGAHKRPIVEFALEDRRKLRLREQRIQRGLAKARAKVKAGLPEPPLDPSQGHPAPPTGSGGPQGPPRAPPGTPPGTPWAGFCTQGPGHRGAPGAPRTKVLAVPSHHGPKIRKRDKGKAQHPPKPSKAPKGSQRREKLRLPPHQSQQRRRGSPGGAEARFQELVERYKRKILGTNPPTARRSKWFES